MTIWQSMTALLCHVVILLRGLEMPCALSQCKAVSCVWCGAGDAGRAGGAGNALCTLRCHTLRLRLNCKAAVLLCCYAVVSALCCCAAALCCCAAALCRCAAVSALCCFAIESVSQLRLSLCRSAIESQSQRN